MPTIKVSPFFIIYSTIIVFTDSPYILPTILGIILHELGHILCAKILRKKITRLTLSPLGAQMKLEGIIPYKDELLIALSGPLLGILGFLFAFPFAHRSEMCSAFAIISLSLSIFNLLPLPSLDGGRILRCALCSLVSLNIAEKVSKTLGFFTLCLLWAFTVYFMIKLAGGLSVFIFCSIFFLKCFVFDAKKGDFKRFQEHNQDFDMFF